jgi:hypothetical protein
MRRSSTGRGSDEASGRGFRADDRAQTVLDFGMGVGLFLVAIVFVLGVVPGMFDPFTAGTDTGVGDRVASSLAGDVLGDPASPSVLDEECTWAFFDQMQTGTDASTNCRFDTTADDPEAVFGVGNTTSLNVSITDFEGTPVVFSVGGSDRTLSAGDPLPTRSSVTTARRSVHLAGNTYRLEVNVW